jgi:hypothetical protein
MTSGVDETKGAAGARRAPLLVGDVPFGQGLSGGAHPLLPLLWGLRRVIGVEEKLPAQRTGTLLRLQETQTEVVHWRGCRPSPPSGPVLGQGRVVR